jgi:diguanylate cyclase (GGDEF)-like protein
VLPGRRSSNAPSRQVPVLFIMSGLDAGRLIALEATETLIGRDKDVHVQLSEAAMSRKHARIVRNGERFVLEDLKSRNGTFVNGNRIEQRELQVGDHLSVGPNVTLRFGIIDQAEAEIGRQLFEASTRDTLTQAYNRKYLNERLAAELSFAHRHGGHLGIAMLDVDHFKRVNDTHGHAAGDTVLRTIARRVARLVRTEDVFARYGGEEFVVLARGIDLEGMRTLAERVRRTVADGVVEHVEPGLPPLTMRVTVSLGVAEIEECGANVAPSAFLALADRRLYRAKEAGRNQAWSRGE